MLNVLVMQMFEKNMIVNLVINKKQFEQFLMVGTSSKIKRSTITKATSPVFNTTLVKYNIINFVISMRFKSNS